MEPPYNFERYSYNDLCLAQVTDEVKHLLQKIRRGIAHELFYKKKECFIYFQRSIISSALTFGKFHFQLNETRDPRTSLVHSWVGLH